MEATEGGDVEPMVGVVGIDVKPNPAKLWAGVLPERAGPRRYQSQVSREGKSWVLFAPSGPDPKFFRNFCHRINADGWRPRGAFPAGLSLWGLDLRSTLLEIYSGSSERTAWVYANLSGAQMTGNIRGVFLSVFASNLRVCQTNLSLSMFYGAVLQGADFSESLQKQLRIDETSDTRGAIGLDPGVQESRPQIAGPELDQSPE
jgi:hypothetical protein